MIISDAEIDAWKSFCGNFRLRLSGLGTRKIHFLNTLLDDTHLVILTGILGCSQLCFFLLPCEIFYCRKSMCRRWQRNPAKACIILLQAVILCLFLFREVSAVPKQSVEHLFHFRPAESALRIMLIAPDQHSLRAVIHKSPGAI